MHVNASFLQGRFVAAGEAMLPQLMVCRARLTRARRFTAALDCALAALRDLR